MNEMHGLDPSAYTSNGVESISIMHGYEKHFSCTDYA